MIYKRCSIKEEVQEKEVNRIEEEKEVNRIEEEKEVNRIEEEKEVNQKNAKETNQ